MSFYEFASNSPWLTVFLAMILGDVLVKIARAVFNRKPSTNKIEITNRKDEK